MGLFKHKAFQSVDRRHRIKLLSAKYEVTAIAEHFVFIEASVSRPPTGSGLISATPWTTISGLKLRDRKGNPQNMTMLTFADALNILNSNSSGTGMGPVIIADLKDQSSWPAYLGGVSLVQQLLPSGTQPAVIFKMKMKGIPSIAQVQAKAQSHPAMGHILPVVNPEDGADNPNAFDGPDWDDSVGVGNWSPTSSNFQALLNLYNNAPNFVQQFELNINNVGDGASTYAAPGPGGLPSFATYYESRFYPEGVSTISRPDATHPDFYTNCCYLADLPFNPNPPADSHIDLRGVLNFSVYITAFLPLRMCL